jgi:tetratricopeptide (TPR) repeat protein
MLSSPYSKLIAGLLLVIVTLIVFSPAARHGFINYDDDRYVTDNPQVRAGLQWSTISWAFTTFEQANWHPLTWLSHALDCQLFHLNPTGHHVTSLLLHSLNVVLLFLILQWFTGYTGRSLMVAALFALHPLNVESVAWVAERKSVLSMFFFLLAIAAYGWYAKKPGIGRYLVIAGLFAAGLMSKPMVITLPFVLLLLDYWPLERIQLSPSIAPGDKLPRSANRFAARTESIVRLCLEKIPLLLLSAASAGMTMMVQQAGGAVVSSARASVLLRIENAVVSYGLYLAKMIWPSRLAVLYAYPHALPMWEIATASIFLVAVTWAVLKYRTSRYLAMGWFWYLGTMVPMIGLVQVGNQAMADRYAYLPLIGVFLMTVWGVANRATALRIETKYLAALGCAVLLALSWATRIQLTYWQDDFTLWTHALAINAHNFVAENNLGFALIRQGKRDDAIAHFRTAAALEPADPTSQFNLGIYAEEQGDLPQATARYEAVLRLTSDTQLRASAFANLGTIYFQLRDYARAKQCFEASVKLNRSFPMVIQDLGLIAQKNGDPGETIRYFGWLVSIDPNDVHYFLLAQAFRQAGREADATWAYQQALRLSKDINQTRQVALQLQAQ